MNASAHKFRPCIAFSLIEVTLSLAIVAFVLLTIMALMPTGMKMMSDSSQSEVSANIITELRGQFQQMPFSNNGAGDANYITSLPLTNYYYDTYGTLTNSSAAANGPVYMASFSLPVAATNYVNGDPVGIGTNNAMPVTVVLAYPILGAAAIPIAGITKYTTNVIFVAKQVGL